MQQPDHPGLLERGQILGELPDVEADNRVGARDLGLDQVVDQGAGVRRRGRRGRYTWALARM
jgi:hypothetical protein